MSINFHMTFIGTNTGLFYILGLIYRITLHISLT